MDSYFNIVSFGSHFKFMYNDSQKTTQESIQQTVSRIE